jgi:hypothetical protein
MGIQTTVLVAQPADPGAFMRLVKPGPRIGTGLAETGGPHRILCSDGHFLVAAPCLDLLDNPEYVDEDGTTYVEVTRGDPADPGSTLPMIPADGQCLIAAAYYLRWQKPIPPEEISRCRAELDRILGEPTRQGKR